MIKSRGVLKMSQRSRHDMKDQKKKKKKKENFKLRRTGKGILCPLKNIGLGYGGFKSLLKNGNSRKEEVR